MTDSIYPGIPAKWFIDHSGESLILDYHQVQAEIERLQHAVDLYVEGAQRADDRADLLEEALMQIEAWSRAYPLKVFPEPDFAKAAELLKAGGMTLDAISASNMRHVVEGVGKIARAALNHKPGEKGE